MSLPHPFVATLCAALLLGNGSAALAQACTPDTAAEHVTALYERLSEEQEAPLRKEKRGHVLVARRSPLSTAIADPESLAELNRELRRTAGLLGSKPLEACAAVQRIRHKYELR